MWTALNAWWVQNVVANDPAPEYTYLDKQDGLDSRGV